MKSAKEVQHILINLYCRTFGGDHDELEVWDDHGDNYMVMRKEDGWVLKISIKIVDQYLSGDRSMRKKGKAQLIRLFHNFEPSSD